MHRYFLAPRSGERSYDNFVSTIKHGVPYARIEKFLNEDGRGILRKQEVIYAWGNRKGKSAEWSRMQPGDTVIFYAHKTFVVAGEVIFKQHNPDLALAMWPPDENGNPWEYTFFVKNLTYFKIPLSHFNFVSGYRYPAIMGFTEVRDSAVEGVVNHYGSFEELFRAFEDESSEEILQNAEKMFVNLPEETVPSVSDKKIIAYKPHPTTASGKKKKGYVDFDEVNRHRARIGSLGEEIVLKHERDRLIKAGRDDLAKKVHQVSQDDTYAGYDILSFESNGEEKQIEVKATVAKQADNFVFHISRNEKEVADSASKYSIYLVYGVDTNSPTIHVLDSPFKDGHHLLIEPEKFVVKGRFA